MASHSSGLTHATHASTATSSTVDSTLSTDSNGSSGSGKSRSSARSAASSAKRKLRMLYRSKFPNVYYTDKASVYVKPKRRTSKRSIGHPRPLVKKGRSTVVRYRTP